MRALVLSGGAKKGALQTGVLQKWLVEDQIEYDIFCGVSVGALNSSFLAQFPYGDPKNAGLELLELWNRVQNVAVKKNWFMGYLASLWKKSVYCSKPLQDWVMKELSCELIKNSGKKLRIVSVCWNDTQINVADEHDPNIQKYVLASSSYPVFLEPIKIDNKEYTDGGLRSVTPLGQAIEAGADEIDIIMCSNPDLSSNWDTTDKHVIDYALRAIDIMGDEIVRSDLKECGLKNEIAQLNGKYKNIKIRLIQPDRTFGSPLDFNPDQIKEMIDWGYDAAHNKVIEL